VSTGFPAIDNDPHPDFRVYSAGNLGEVAPERLSPMSWSLVGIPMERGTRKLVRQVWGTVPWARGSHYVFLGYFACRPYHNLAAYSHLASQFPRVTARDLTAAYFEGVEPPEIDAHGKESVLRRASAIPRMLRVWGRLTGEVNRLEEEVTVLEDLARRAIERRGEVALHEVLLRAAPLLDDAWAAHVVTTGCVVPMTVLQRELNKRLMPGEEGIEAWLNRPRELVWGRMYDFAGEPGALAPGEFLTSSFYEVADDLDPWRRFVVRNSVAATGPEPDHDGVLGLDEALWGMLPRGRRRVVRSAARVVGDMMTSREHSKSVVMRLIHLHRRVLPELAAVWSLPEDAWPYLTIEEFREVHREPGALDLVGPRREQCLAAVDLPMPEHLDLSGGSPAPWDAGVRRAARGVSPGRVTGVVITSDADDPPDDAPCVLVCGSADADVAPLLRLVDGVVTMRGSEMSHIAILAREHGIPAVVGYADAGRLRPGDLITIDGKSGEVHVEPAG
jgi:phosphohistidine swiveling domain-containing protein